VGLFLIGCGGSGTDSDGPTVDRTDPAATAKAILGAYKEKDLALLSKLSSETNAGIMAAMAEQGEGHGRYKSFFSGWRWDAVSGWDGQVGEVRYRGADAAAVRFGKFSDAEIAIVSLVWGGGKWCFDDVNRSELSRFESLPADRPASGS
jgi:hypothetical protein